MKKIVILIMSLFIIASYFIYQKLNPKELPAYLIQAVGRIDGDLINLNTKYPARVKNIYFDVGDEVKKGDIIATLDSKEFQEKLKAIKYQIEAKNSELNITILKVKNNISKAKKAMEIKKETLKIINYEINSLENMVNQDKKDEKRIESLVNKKLAKHHELELAKLKTKTDINKLNILYKKRKIIQKEINIAQNDLNIVIASKNSIKALKDGILALKAQKNELKTIINELNLTSPVDGYVDTKVANIGEVIGAGGVVESIIDKNSFYLKIFVDTLNNGKIKIGNKAEIFLDSYPNKAIPAKVIKIAKKAEFTPKEVAVKSDRITRVYEVHLKPLKNNPFLKLGLPATGVILIGNGELPKSLNNLPEL